MGERYVPKVGDTVRATLGESVVYGYVRDRGVRSVTLSVDERAYTLELDGLAWHFEPRTPPIQFKPLTVVRLDDDAFKALDPDDSLISESRYNNSPFAVRLMNNYWVQPGDTDWELGDDDIARILAVGKAEVLFGGVEE